MRCGCKYCGVYMIHAESTVLGCVCPGCGARCRDCLGTDSVISRDDLRALKGDPAAFTRFLEDTEADAEEEEDSSFPFDDRYDDL
ncbi:MAG: hypothetical protein IJH78_05670 [Clostridia bacterium]|nr:hypothetical protein [Clostridia bacterium]